MGDEIQEVYEPHILGCNWAASTSDIKELGGFDENYGPGSGAAGQEGDMQMRLINDGVQGYYLPDAAVWHFVEKGRCTPEWSLSYAKKHGVTHGRWCNDPKLPILKMPGWVLKKLIKDVFIFFIRNCNLLCDRTKQFESKYRLIQTLSMVKTIRKNQ